MKKTTLKTICLLAIMSVTNGLLAQTYYPVTDTYVDQNVPGTSYGLVTSLVTRTSTVATRITFIEFDVADFSGTVNKAELNLYFNYRGTTTGTDIVDVYEVTSGTISNDLTWSNYLASPYNIVISGSATASASITTTNPTPTNYGWYKWDITSIVQNAGSSKKVKIALKMRGTTLFTTFYSKEGTGISKPNLVINPIATALNSVDQLNKSVVIEGNNITFRDSKKVSGSIYNTQGVILKAVKDVSSIDVSSLLKGIYILRLQDNSVFKFLKN